MECLRILSLCFLLRCSLVTFPTFLYLSFAQSSVFYAILSFQNLVAGVGRRGTDLHPALPLFCLLPVQQGGHSALLQGSEERNKGERQEDEAKHIPAVAFLAIG